MMMSNDIIKIHRKREKLWKTNQPILPPPPTNAPVGPTKACKHCKSLISKNAKVCPFCQKKQGGVGKWIALAVVLVIIIGAIAGSGGSETQKASADKPSGDSPAISKNSGSPDAKETEKPIEYTAYTVDEMMETLDANALNAKNTFDKQYVEITGKLSNIDANGKYISLHSENDEFAIVGVQCYIKNDEQTSKVASMSIGDIVTLKGKITSVGEVMGYSLDIDEIK